VLIVEDHEILAKGLTRLLESCEDFEVVGVSCTVKEAVSTALDLRPDVVLMDYQLPDGDGVTAVEQIKQIQQGARARGETIRPRWPMIVLNSPKGWTGPKVVDGLQIEGTFRAHQVPLSISAQHPEHLPLLEGWLKSYRPAELFDSQGRLQPELAELAPIGGRRMGANPHANGGALLRDLRMPDFREYALSVPSPGVGGPGDTLVSPGIIKQWGGIKGYAVVQSSYQSNPSTYSDGHGNPINSIGTLANPWYGTDGTPRSGYYDTKKWRDPTLTGANGTSAIFGGQNQILLRYAEILLDRAECKVRTNDITGAMADLKLDELHVVYPGDERYSLAKKVDVVPLAQMVNAE